MSPAAADDRRQAAAHVLLGADDVLDADMVSLDDDTEHHLRRVMRLRDGESVSVTDGAGRWRLTRAIVSASMLSLESQSDVMFEERAAPFTIASAIPKGDRVEWLVQKTAELGADRIELLHTANSTTRWKSDRADKQIPRLQRIADEATRQSRRVWRTEVVGPLDALDVLARCAIAEPGSDVAPSNEAAIAIGPEGGWSLDEILMAPSRVTLSANILRVETAAVVATALRMAVGH